MTKRAAVSSKVNPSTNPEVTTTHNTLRCYSSGVRIDLEKVRKTFRINQKMQQESYTDSTSTEESENEGTENYDYTLQTLIITTKLLRRDLQKLKKENKLLQKRIDELEMKHQESHNNLVDAFTKTVKTMDYRFLRLHSNQCEVITRVNEMMGFSP